MPVTERFGGLRRIGLHKTGVAVRQVHRKEVDLAFNPGDLRQRLAKIHLCMARIVPQRNKYFAMSQTARQHVVLNDGDPASVAVLVAKPFEDPLRGVPLLSRPTFIRRQDPVDDPGKRIQLRTRRRPAPGIRAGPKTPASSLPSAGRCQNAAPLPAGSHLLSERQNEPERKAPRPSSPSPCRLTTKAICCRIFTPAPPHRPAVSVRDFCSGAYISSAGRQTASRRKSERCREISLSGIDALAELGGCASPEIASTRESSCANASGPTGAATVSGS